MEQEVDFDMHEPKSFFTKYVWSQDHKVIAIPRDSKMNFLSDSIPNSIKSIIQTWFCNYKGQNKMEFIAWGDKEDAIYEIEKWSVNK